MPGMFVSVQIFMQQAYKEKILISNIIQADFWAKINDLNKIVLPYYIFFDNFEPKKSSRAGKHKLGGIYGLIGCLSPDIASKIDSINLIFIFYSDHRKKFGNEIIFGKLIREFMMKESKLLLIIKNTPFLFKLLW